MKKIIMSAISLMGLVGNIFGGAFTANVKNVIAYKDSPPVVVFENVKNVEGNVDCNNSGGTAVKWSSGVIVLTLNSTNADFQKYMLSVALTAESTGHWVRVGAPEYQDSCPIDNLKIGTSDSF